MELQGDGIGGEGAADRHAGVESIDALCSASSGW
jgi:hypothetical protein